VIHPLDAERKLFKRPAAMLEELRRPTVANGTACRSKLRANNTRLGRAHRRCSWSASVRSRGCIHIILGGFGHEGLSRATRSDMFLIRYSRPPSRSADYLVTTEPDAAATPTYGACGKLCGRLGTCASP
jgi:hypothetical protein